MVTEPLYLIGIDIGCAHLNSCGQIDDHRVFRRRGQYRVYRVTHRHRKIQLGPGKTFRTVLKNPFCLGLGFSRSFHQLCAGHGNLSNTGSIEAEYVFTLYCRSAVIKVNDRPACTR